MVRCGDGRLSLLTLTLYSTVSLQSKNTARSETGPVSQAYS